MTRSVTLHGEAEALRDDLAQHDDVENVQVNSDRRPHRVDVVLASDAVPEGVRDIVADHQATIEDPFVVYDDSLEGDLLGLVLRPSQAWRPAGQRALRAHGGSIVCTLTRESLEASGLGKNTEVDLVAREDEVRITRRDDQ